MRNVVIIFLQFLLIVTFTFNSTFAQNKLTKTAPFISKLLGGNDTLTIFSKEHGTDSIIINKFQSYKRGSNFVMKKYYPVKLNKGTSSKDFQKLKFREYSSCDYEPVALEPLAEVEKRIRSNCKEKGKCQNGIDYFMILGKKKYSTKHHLCEQTLLIDLKNRFDCLIPDPDTKRQQ